MWLLINHSDRTDYAGVDQSGSTTNLKSNNSGPFVFLYCVGRRKKMFVGQKSTLMCEGYCIRTESDYHIVLTRSSNQLNTTSDEQLHITYSITASLFIKQKPSQIADAASRKTNIHNSIAQAILYTSNLK